MPAPNEITPAQLLHLIGTPTCPVLIDVCLPGDFDADSRLITGAARHSHTAAAGLLALPISLPRQYRSDHQQLEAGIALYDALYRWARDGQDEGHDWPLKDA